jgi:hypothetical protein
MSVDAISRETLAPGIIERLAAKAAGRIQRVHHGGALCSRCLVAPPSSAKTHYCRPCHADAERKRRSRQRVSTSRPNTDAAELLDRIYKKTGRAA